MSDQVQQVEEQVEGQDDETETNQEERPAPPREQEGANLQEMQEKMQRLERNWEAARVMLSENSDVESRVSATRDALKAMGHTDDDIEHYVGAIRAQYEEEPVEPQIEDQIQYGQPQNSEVEELRQRLAAMEQQNSNAARRQAEEDLIQKVRSQVTAHPEVQKLLSKAQDGEGDSIHQLMFQDAHEATLRSLREAKQQYGRITQADVDQAVKQGVQLTAEKYGKLRAVIGNQLQLGRSPETVAGLEELLESAPVKKPKPGGPTRELQEYNKDLLSRTVAEGLRGGGNKA